MSFVVERGCWFNVVCACIKFGKSDEWKDSLNDE